MAPKRSKRSTDFSLDFLNNINRPRRIDTNAKDPKRRRTTHANIYDIPVSPSPKQSQKVPQTEPRNTSQFNLRNRPAPNLAPSDLPPNFSDNAEEHGPSNGESESGESVAESNSGEPILYPDELSGAEETNWDEYREELESEAEEDPFPEPVDSFPADEDQDGSHTGDDFEQARGEEPGDEYVYDKDQDESHFGEEFEDAPREESGDDYIDEAEGSTYDGSPVDGRGHSTSAQKSPNSHTYEVQVSTTSQSNLSQISRQSVDAQKHQNAPSQLQEVPETPTRQSPSPDQNNQGTGSSIFTWLTETTKESGFKETWDGIRITRKTLKANADSSMKERFSGVKKLIERLHDLLDTITDDPASASSLEHQCSLIANNIFKEVQWIIYEEAPEDELEGAYLVNQLEAHIVPRLIDLVICGFKAYTTIKDRGKRHFRIILDLLWGCCDRIYSLAQMHYDISESVWAYSKKIVRHVKIIKDALNDGRLHAMATRVPRRPPSYKHFLLEAVDGHISCGRWTSAERDALRDGLHLYRGKDRYIDIKCDAKIGSRLSERILQDVEAQAIRLNLNNA